MDFLHIAANGLLIFTVFVVPSLAKKILRDRAHKKELDEYIRLYCKESK